VDGEFRMKALIKKAFSLIGLGVYRLDPSQNNNSKAVHKVVVLSALHHNSKEGLNNFYSDPEAVESFLDHGFYDRLIDLLRTYGVDYDQKRIADIGCGTGGLLKILKAGFQPLSLTGFEYSEKALDIARSQLSDVEFSCFDIYEGSPRKFDVIFCIEVLEHLLHPDTALRHLVGMLADSGVALITVPNGRIDTFEGHINFWSPESWDVFLKKTCEGQSVTTGLIEDGQTNYAVIIRNAIESK
jgi:2-polyprenyl-3-methyl-5-hydroxy-6-metoxy-1,4-benzoquinol methylase